jgi:hypothetical protein
LSQQTLCIDIYIMYIYILPILVFCVTRLALFSHFAGSATGSRSQISTKQTLAKVQVQQHTFIVWDNLRERGQKIMFEWTTNILRAQLTKPRCKKLWLYRLYVRHHQT